MSTAVLRKGLADGWRGLTTAAAVVAAMLVFGLIVYQDIDLSIYEALPEAVRSVMGVPVEADASVLAYNEMLGAIGAMALAGVGIAIGAQAVAGEEGNRTLPLVLAAPVSRTAYALSRAVAMVLLLVAATVVIWAGGALAPLALGIDIGQSDLGALMTHLGANTVFHAAVAFAVGALTGRKSLAAAVAAGVMVLGWLGAGLLPLWREGSAEWVPWTWFNGSKPLVNGVDGGHLALLLGGTVFLVAVGVVGFARREIRLHEGGVSLKERLHALPVVGKLVRPTGRGQSLLGLRFASQRTLLITVTFIMGALMGLVMGPLYSSMEADLNQFAASFPEAMVAMFGGGNMSTPAGFLHIETMGMMAPIAVILLATAAASAGIAGEEHAGRLAGLLATPVSRSRVYWTTAAVMAGYVLVVSVGLFLGLWAGNALGGLEVELANVATACFLMACLGWAFGGFALLLSAASGRPGLVVWGTTGVAIATYFGYTLLMAAGREEWGWWSPFRAYLYGAPIEVGMAWWQPTWLLVAAVALVLAGLPLFARRDLR
ncbi:ABC transporter permease subunit [Tessaracoccus sp. MC1756]|uniref:ABC transporter permease subunit n=1 Tax=Tessaracoccus sp. MC1756 TaxID=2760311 RepID=UPI0015FFE2E0|nr:ABC transporter permease subunit [Tessaracoccus sp. MC1756]